jgi:hypothetical protein
MSSFGQTTVQDASPVTTVIAPFLGTYAGTFSGIQFLIDGDTSSQPIEKNFSKADIQSFLADNNTTNFSFPLTLTRPGNYSILTRETYTDGSEATLGNVVSLDLASKPDAPVLSVTTPASVTVNGSDTSKIDMSNLVVKVALPSNTGGRDLNALTFFVSSKGTINSFSRTLSSQERTDGEASIGIGNGQIVAAWLQGLTLGSTVKMYASVDNVVKLESPIGAALNFSPTIKPASPSVTGVASGEVDSADSMPMMTVSGSISSDAGELSKWSQLSILIRGKGGVNWAVTDKANLSKASLNLVANEYQFTIPVKEFVNTPLNSFEAYEVAAILHTSNVSGYSVNASAPLSQSNISSFVTGYAGYSQAAPKQSFTQNPNATTSIVDNGPTAGTLNIAYVVSNGIPQNLKAEFSLVKNGVTIKTVVKQHLITDVQNGSPVNVPFSLPAGQWSKADAIKVVGKYSKPLSASIAAIAGSSSVPITTIELPVSFPPQAGDLPKPKSVAVTQIKNVNSNEIGFLVNHISPKSTDMLGCDLTQITYEIAADEDFQQKAQFNFGVPNNEVNENQTLFPSNAFPSNMSLNSGFTYYVRMFYEYTSNIGTLLVTDKVSASPIDIAEDVFPGVTGLNISNGGAGIVSVVFDKLAAPAGMSTKNYKVVLNNEYGEQVDSQTINVDQTIPVAQLPATYTANFTLAQSALGQSLSATVIASFLNGSQLVKGQPVASGSYTPDRKPLISSVTSAPANGGAGLKVTALINFYGSASQNVFTIAPSNGNFITTMVQNGFVDGLSKFECTFSKDAGFDYDANGVIVNAFNGSFSTFVRHPALLVLSNN